MQMFVIFCDLIFFTLCVCVCLTVCLSVCLLLLPLPTSLSLIRLNLTYNPCKIKFSSFLSVSLCVCVFLYLCLRVCLVCLPVSLLKLIAVGGIFTATVSNATGLHILGQYYKVLVLVTCRKRKLFFCLCLSKDVPMGRHD